MTETFVHLHVHSDYTLSRGASKVAHLVARAAELGLPAMALVDDSNIFGGLEFSKVASSKGVQPIIGTKLWFGIETEKSKNVKGSILLLAASEQGYGTICSLLAETLRPHGEDKVGGTIPTDVFSATDFSGVICLTGGTDGIVRRLVQHGHKDLAGEMLGWLYGLFGNRLYLELCRFGDETESEIDVESKMLDLAYDLPDPESGGTIGIPVVGTTEVWYATEDCHDAFELLNAVESKSSVNLLNDRIQSSSSRRFHMRSAAEMKALFADIPEAYENAIMLARRCAFMVKGRNPILPPFQTEGGRTEAEELRIQARDGLNRRLDYLQIAEEDRAQYRERLEYELGVIEQMEFPGYFLIVSDFIRWAKGRGIPVGPGRGSGAGSLVAYSLEITDLDPLRFGLLFERFLNPERVSMPDFDVDFCQDRREEVINYVREKYGTDFVSLIATFGVIKSKTAVKDVGRVIRSDDFGGYSFGELDSITKLIPMDGANPKSLKDSYEDASDTEFRARIDSETKYRLLFENARKIEGLYRSQGSHAAGVIIAGQPLQSLVPVGWDDEKQMPVCQFNMKAAETVGLVKFDFLGLKTLSVIREAIEHIKATTGNDIDLGSLPFDDAPTYEMLADGMSNGVFQFESDGMKRVLRDIRPTRIEDLIAVAALFRPGPMDMIPHYADCKNGKAEPQYPEPVERTKPFLEETFGIMVYQEQVMQVAQVVAGYSLGGADLLRRAMGKKIPAEMAAQREMFVKGATERGTPKESAEQLFDLIARFAGYGFNKSHAAAYAVIAYHTAWLKRHYPAEFLAALLTYETSSPEKMAKVKEDMDAFGVEMLPPCINASSPRFVPERKPDGSLHIRFGLSAIKGISSDLPILLDARRAGGPFKDLQDFHVRAGSQFNSGQIQKLAEAGAFDRIAKNRRSAVDILSFLAKHSKTSGATNDLFGGTLAIQLPEKVGDVPEWGNVADREFNAVGFYFGSHPLDAYEARFKNVQVKRKASLRRWMQENKRAELKTKKLGGLVERAERRASKKSGKPYIWASFTEKNDKFDAFFFANDPVEIERIRTILENAKTVRRPVIVVADLLLEDGKDDITIWGRDVLDADEILSRHRGDITIGLSADEIILSVDERREIKEVEERVHQGLARQELLNSVATDVRNRAMARKIAQVESLLSRMRKDDEDEAASVTLMIGANGKEYEMKLPGRYIVGSSEENAIKSLDGVMSFREKV